jgi:hypothetical protein
VDKNKLLGEIINDMPDRVRGRSSFYVSIDKLTGFKRYRILDFNTSEFKTSDVYKVILSPFVALMPVIQHYSKVGDIDDEEEEQLPLSNNGPGWMYNSETGDFDDLTDQGRTFQKEKPKCSCGGSKTYNDYDNPNLAYHSSWCGLQS